jgi:hypothetical protein
LVVFYFVNGVANKEVCDKVNIGTIYTCPKKDNPVKISLWNENKRNHQQNPTNILTWLANMKKMWSDFPIYVEGQNAKPNLWLQQCLQTGEMELSPSLRTTNYGKLHGKGIVSFRKGSHCQDKLGIEQINGTFYNNVLNGMTTISFLNSTILRVPYNNGTKSGLGRVFKCIFDACDFETEAWNKIETLGKVIEICNSKYDLRNNIL